MHTFKLFIKILFLLPKFNSVSLLNCLNLRYLGIINVLYQVFMLKIGNYMNLFKSLSMNVSDVCVLVTLLEHILNFQLFLIIVFV